MPAARSFGIRLENAGTALPACSWRPPDRDHRANHYGKTVLLTSAPSAGWIYDACAALDFQCKGVGEALGEHEQHFAMALTKPRP
jgi:hypothetical protein